MPRHWDRSSREKRTPFSDLLADYLEAHRWMRPKHLAQDTGLTATTIQRYLNKGVVPRDPNILMQIHAGTGIPLTQLYRAAGFQVPTLPLPIEAIEPPRPRTSSAMQKAQAPAPTAFDDAVERIRASYPPAMAEVMVQALFKRAGREDPRSYWQTRIEEEHDHDHISTLQLPTVSTMPPARTVDADATQQESQPAGSCS